MSHWSENRGPDVSHWSDNVRHDIQMGDVILSQTSSDVSPAAFQDSVVGTIGWGGGGRYGTGEAAETPQEMVVDSECRNESPTVFEDSAAHIIGSGSPRYGTGEAAETPQEMAVDSECQDTVRGTLEGDLMYMVDPRSVSCLFCDPVRSVSDKLVRGQIRFFDRRAEKDSVMFGSGAITSNLWDGCPYRVTSYRDDDHSNLDSPFGVQVHQPRFLEWVGAPESARLLG